MFILLTACSLAPATPMPTAVPTAMPTVANAVEISAESPAGFQQFLTKIDNTQLADRPFALNRYWAQITQSPLVDKTHAVFLYRGEANTVALTGDMTNFVPAAQLALTRINGTDLWWYQGEYEAEARLDYLLVVDEKPVLDPHNPFTVPNPLGLRSEMRMAGFVDSAELTDPITYPAGTLTEHSIESSYLDQRRTFLVYKPASQQIGVPPPLLIVQDGSAALSLIDMPRLLDTLIGRHTSIPLVVAFVPPLDRTNEYQLNDAYAAFLAEELLPFIQAEYKTDPAPTKNGLLGADLGAVAALHTALRYPNRFGLVAAQSGIFSLADDSLMRAIAANPALPLKLHLIVGSYETNIMPDQFADPDILATNQRMAVMLERNGYEFIYQEFAQGHSWGLWRSQIGDALHYLYR
ncbi:MAG TPA: esterase family protein [Anaerolineae bacterium]|nr:esterase family protein [Anaerolineae bacterium]